MSQTLTPQPGLNETQAPGEPAQANTGPFDRLPGGALIWIVFVLEMGTFALFFLGFAWQSRSEPALFASSQARLHPNLATLNTLILLSGSWLAARAVLAARRGRPMAPWLLGTAASGLAFMGIKGLEYAQVFGAGIRLSSNAFWFNYLFLTMLHLLHVALGVWFMLWLAFRHRLETPSGESLLQLEAAAIYWHLVDVIWVLLFPLIYFARSW